jgi:hypothetical protein
MENRFKEIVAGDGKWEESSIGIYHIKAL